MSFSHSCNVAWGHRVWAGADPLYMRRHVGMISHFTAFLNAIFDQFAPITCRRISRPFAPWLNSAVRRLIEPWRDVPFLNTSDLSLLRTGSATKICGSMSKYCSSWEKDLPLYLTTDSALQFWRNLRALDAQSSFASISLDLRNSSLLLNVLTSSSYSSNTFINLLSFSRFLDLQLCSDHSQRFLQYF